MNLMKLWGNDASNMSIRHKTNLIKNKDNSYFHNI